MFKNPFDGLQDVSSFQKFGFSRQITRATTIVEVFLLLAYALVMVLSLPFLFTLK